MNHYHHFRDLITGGMLLAGSLVIANPAMAQVQPYQQFSSASCGTAGACGISFPAVTAKTLILRASCFWELPTNAVTSFVTVGTAKNNPRQWVPSFTNPRGGLNGVPNAFNAETYLFVNSGDSPLIEVFTAFAGAGDVDCTISGIVP